MILGERNHDNLAKVLGCTPSGKILIQVVDLPTAQQLGSDGVEWEPYCWSEDLAKEFLGKLGGGVSTGVSMVLGFGDFLVLCWWLLVCLLVSFTVLLMVILRGSVDAPRLQSPCPQMELLHGKTWAVQRAVQWRQAWPDWV